MAVGSNFEVYLNVSTMMLMYASNTRGSKYHDELIEYVNELQEGILEIYICIIQGIKDESCV